MPHKSTLYGKLLRPFYKYCKHKFLQTLQILFTNTANAFYKHCKYFLQIHQIRFTNTAYTFYKHCKYFLRILNIPPLSALQPISVQQLSRSNAFSIMFIVIVIIIIIYDQPLYFVFINDNSVTS